MDRLARACTAHAFLAQTQDSTGFIPETVLLNQESLRWVDFDMKTLVLGASTNPARYSYLATQRLLRAGHEVVLVGNREGQVFDQPILKEAPLLEQIDTVTLYLGPKNQLPYYEYLTEQLRPRRIIFNPGTENPALRELAQAHGIETEEACTLVMLGAHTY